MTTRRTHRPVAVAALLCLVLAACGTRLDRDTIVAASAAQAGTDVESGESAPGSEGMIGEPGDATVDGDIATQDPTGVAGQPDQTASAASGASGLSGAPGAGGGGTGGPPIVIGNLGTYTGPAGVSWAQGPRALQAWAAATNAAGGISGRKVQVIVMDDGNDPAKARSQAKELVERRKAVAIVGAMTSPHTLAAWKDYLEQKKIPVIGGDCSTLPWTNSPLLFSQCPWTQSQMDGLALVGAKYGKGKKVGGLFCSESDACAYAEDRMFGSGKAAERFGLEPRYKAKISLAQADFTAECLQARNNGVELLVVAADVNTVGRVGSSCRRQNYSPQFLQPSATVGADTAGKPGLENVLASMPVFPFTGLNSPASREFEAVWKKHGGGQAPGPAASLGWASAKVFEKAARAAGGDITSAGLVKQLYTFRGERFGGLTVPLTYVAGKGTANTTCTFVMRGAGGKWTAPAGDKPECW